jgi:hypothetical protein
VLRDNLAGLIEPMFDSAGAVLKLRSRAVVTNKKGVHRTIDPVCLENPAPKGRKHLRSSNPEFPNFLFPSQMLCVLIGAITPTDSLKLSKPTRLYNFVNHGSI